MGATHGSHHYLNGQGHDMGAPAGVFYSAQTSPSFSPYAAQANGTFEGPQPVGLGIDYMYPGPPTAPSVSASGAYETGSEHLHAPNGHGDEYNAAPAGWRYAPVPPPPAPLSYEHGESAAAGHEWPIATSMGHGDSAPGSADGRLPGVAAYTQASSVAGASEPFGHHNYSEGTHTLPASKAGFHEGGASHGRAQSPLQHATEHDMGFQPPDAHDA